MLAVLLFLLIQSRLDGRDPKLRAAPLAGAETSCPSATRTTDDAHDRGGLHGAQRPDGPAHRAADRPRRDRRRLEPRPARAARDAAPRWSPAAPAYVALAVVGERLRASSPAAATSSSA